MSAITKPVILDETGQLPSQIKFLLIENIEILDNGRLKL